MPSQNTIAMPRQYPPLIDRLRATLREVDEDLQSHPNHTTAREFRRFLIGAIDDIESRLDAAA